MLSKTKFPLNPRTLEEVHILLVDNDRDTRDLYTFLLEDQGAKVTTSRSIQDALNILDRYIPNLLICEMRFLGESVLPLIQRTRFLAINTGRSIPILAVSTFNPINLPLPLAIQIEAYLLKPIDLEDFLNQVRNLEQLSKKICSSSMCH